MATRMEMKIAPCLMMMGRASKEREVESRRLKR